MAQITVQSVVALGDFNDFLAQSEKRGKVRYPNHLIQGFQDAVQYSRLSEENLDRALASRDWHSLFQGAFVANEDATVSDHSALILCTKRREPRKHIFRFENAWTREEECRNLISQLTN